MAAGILNPDSAPQQGPPIARAEVYAAFGAKVGVVDTVQVDRAKALLDLRRNAQQTDGVWGRDAIKQIDQVRSIRTGERWSTGMASKDKAVFQESGNKKEAEQKIGRVQIVMSALEVTNIKDPQLQKEKFAEVKKQLAELKAQKVISSTVTSVDELIDLAASVYAQDGATSQLLGDLPTQKARETLVKKIITGDLGRDLQVALGHHMGEARTSLVAITQESSTSDTLAAKIEAAKRMQTVSVDTCIGAIERANPTLGQLGQTQRATLEAAFQIPDESQRKIAVEDAVAQIVGVPANKTHDVGTFVRNEQRIAQINAELGRIAPTDKKTRPNLIAEKNTLTTENGTLTVVQTQVDRYRSAQTLAHSGVFSAAETAYVAQIGQVNSLELQSLASGKPGEVSMDRFNAEGEVLQKIDMVLAEAVNDVLAIQEDRVAEAKKIESDDNIKKAAEKGEKQKADDLISIQNAMEKRWIEGKPNEKKDVVHLKNIGDDMRLMAYYGENGVKIMVLRDMGIVDKADFARLRSGKISSAELINEKLNTDLRKERFNSVYTEQQSKDYREKLMQSYFKADRFRKNIGFLENKFPGITRKGVTIDYSGYSKSENGVFGSWKAAGDFPLRENEWGRLYDGFQDQIMAAFEKSQESQQFMNELKASGVVGENKMKFLYILMFMLLGLGIGGPVFGPAGAAIGAAAGLRQGQQSAEQQLV